MAKSRSQPSLTSILITNALAISRPHFKHFFSGWSGIIQAALKEDCQRELAQYFDVNSTNGSARYLSNAVVDCILGTDYFTDTRKLEMSAAALVLGLTPTIMQSFCPTPAEISMLSFRRPGLALLLAAGSPVVNAAHSGDYMTVVQRLRQPTTLPPWPSLLAGRDLSIFVSVLEYLLATGAAANVALAAYQLSTRTVIVYMTMDYIFVPIWTYLALVLHFGGVLALYLRVKEDQSNESRPKPTNKKQMAFFQAGLWSRLLHKELKPAAYAPALIFDEVPESWLFLLVAWLVYICTILHLLLGTLVMSGLSLINLSDSIFIILRYIFGAIVCRLVTKFELLGLQEVVQRNQPR